MQRFADHHRLRIEPASLVEQPAQADPLGAVVRQGVLVVYRIQQPFVADMEQGHARRFVDTPALGLDDAVLYLVAHAQPVAAPDLVGLEHQLNPAGEAFAVDRDGIAMLETERDLLRFDGHGGIPELDSHDRFHGLQRDRQVFQGLGLVGGTPDVGIGGIGLLLRIAIGQAVFG